MSCQTQREGCVQVLAQFLVAWQHVAEPLPCPLPPGTPFQTDVGRTDRGTPVLLKGTGRGAGNTGQKQVHKWSILRLITGVTKISKKLAAQSSLKSYQAEPPTLASALPEVFQIQFIRIALQTGRKEGGKKTHNQNPNNKIQYSSPDRLAEGSVLRRQYNFSLRCAKL